MPAKKQSKSKVVLISYTIKATIPTGQYANIQPEVTVQAETIEQAERLVMPYIETLFARYRDGGVKNIEPVRPVVAAKIATTGMKQPAGPVVVTPAYPATPVTSAPDPVVAKVINTPAQAQVAQQPVPAPVVAAPAIVLSVPFNRAKQALESCTSLAALKLVSDQVEKSTKLVDAEKVDLRKLSEAKLNQLNGTKGV